MEPRRLFGSFVLTWSHAGSGFSRAPDQALRKVAPDAEATSYDFGDAGRLTIAVDGGERAENERTLVVTLGGLRDSSGSRLAAADLLRRRLATPAAIDGAALTGNGLVLAFDKREPRFSAYGTLLALPQFLYSSTADGFAAASEPRLLLPQLDAVEIDEAAVPAHFLFRFVPGRRTYFRGVARLFPGELLRFDAGRTEIRRLRTLRDLAATVPRFARIDEESLAWLDRAMSGALAAWLDEAALAGRKVGNLLSGGLDSSLVQAWLGEAGAGREPGGPGGRGSRRARTATRKSWSFTVAAPSFAFEERYAREASALLGSEHSFAAVTEGEYPALFDRALDVLAEPTLYNEGWACQLAAADLVAADVESGGVGSSATSTPWAVFAGNAADALHGVGDLRAIGLWRQLAAHPRRRARLAASIETLRRRPGAVPWVDALEMTDAPQSLLDPTSFVSIAGELAYALPAFGEAALFRAFEERRALEAELYGSDELFERVQMLDLVTAGYDPTLAMVRLFASRGVDVVQLYLDEAAIAAPFAFPREIRYVRRRGPWPRRLKPLQQELLVRRGLGALVGRKKGGTNFNDDLWRWLTSGCLAERTDAIERPGWLDAKAFERMKGSWNDFLWNLLVFDGWRRRVVEPAARAAEERRR